MSAPIRVFVASSSEQLDVARDLKKFLKRKGLDVFVWDEDIFEFSKSFIGSLERELGKADYAIVIMTAVDSAVVRGKMVNLPRDNVIFELGLVFGKLGRDRCFFFVEQSSDTQLASDLSGVNPVWFCRDGSGHEKLSLQRQAAMIGRTLLDLGPRYKQTQKAREDQEKLWRFSSRVSGHWWERMRKGEDIKAALSFVTMSFDPVTNEVDLQGRTYGPDGEPFAEWKSVMTDVDRKQRTVHYHWEGERDRAHGQLLGGAGRVVFDDSLESARGFFWDTNFARVSDGESETWSTNFELFRCSREEAEIMKQPSSGAARALIQQKLKDLRR